MAKAFNANNFNHEVLDSDVPVLVDFWASWCGPCRMLGPVIDELSAEAEGFKVGKVNIDEEPGLVAKYNIMSVPTVIVFKDGKPVKQSSGYRPKKDLKSLLSV